VIGDGPSLSQLLNSLCDKSEKKEEKKKKIKLTNYFNKFINFLFGFILVMFKWISFMFKPQKKILFKKGKIGKKKTLIYNETGYPISDVKKMAHNLNGTVNDFMFTCFIGALDRYRKRNEKKKEKVMINIGIPMTLRTQHDEVYNHFGICIASVHLGMTKFKK
jgi:hypothetical protein